MKARVKFIFIFTLLTLMCSPDLNAQDILKSARRDKWYVPDFATLQYAGSIGFISAGGGYNLFKNRAGVEILFGYVPVFAGGVAIETITLKFTGTVWTIPVSEKVILHPLAVGTSFCYTPGREYSSDLPSWYPDGYYWWSEAVRVNIFIGGSGDMILPKGKKIGKINFYYELGTNEIKLVSYIQNSKALRLIDILHAGIGVRAHFGK